MHQDDWERIRIRLFRADEPANEAFVSRVMARIEAEARAVEARVLSEVEAWSFADWLTPALGFAFAGFLLFYARPQADTEPFPDTVIQSAAFQDLQARWSLSGPANPAD